MKKKWNCHFLPTRGKWLKSYWLVRNFMILFFALNLSVFANGLSQEVSLARYNNATLIEVFEDLKVQTGYGILYKTQNINPDIRVNLNVENSSVQEILNDVLEGTKLDYKVQNEVIVIFKSEKINHPEVINQEQEKKEIAGKVTDEKGIPLPGVSVVVKGTNYGVSTNIEGEYTLSLENETNRVLVISFVGMASQEVKLGSSLVYNVVLKNDSENLNEVVVTGYQVIEKRKLSSSVVSVKASKILETGAVSIDKMLQGKIVGMSVIGQTATLGAVPKIRIRGSSSITGNREPVWVVDGVVIDDPVDLSTTELNSMDKVNLIGNAISFINPEDIDRIDVLKDASATAIYGVKAANGVIVVTTKKGSFGPPVVQYTNSTTFTQRPTYDVLDRMNSKERIEASQEMHTKGLRFNSFMPSRVAYEGALMDLWDKNTSYDEFSQQIKTLKERNTDWYDVLFRNTINMTHDVSVSGASKKSNYYASVGYTDQKGLEIGTSYKKYNIRLKLTTRLSDKVSVNFNVNAASTENNKLHASVNPYKYAYNTSRAIAAYNPDGSRSFYAVKKPLTSGSFNPIDITEPFTYNILHEIDHTGQTIKNNSIFSTLGLNWKVIKGLKFSSLLNVSQTRSKTESYTDDKSYDAQVKRKLPYGSVLTEDYDISNFKDKSLLPYGGELDVNNTDKYSYTFRNTLTYTKDIGAHFLNAIAGFEAKSTETEGLRSLNFGYLPERGRKFATVTMSEWESFDKLNKNTSPVITDNENNIMSYFGVLSYSFKDKYILNFNVRTDGSNRFGKDKSTRFLPVWSVSGRYNISDEALFEQSKWLDYLTFKTSYGVQGNVSPDHIPNLIVQLGALNDVAGEFSSSLYKVPNHNLKWEKTTSYNLGLEFGFFNGALSGTLETYYKKGTDQIVSKQISPTTGASKVSINDGTIINKGWEIALNSILINNENFQWTVAANTSKNSNKITNAGSPLALTVDDYLDGRLVMNDRPVNSFYSYKFKGLDANGLPTFNDFNEKDEEGNMLVNSQSEAFERIFEYSGKREADLTGGFSNSFTYKGISLNATFAFSVGNKVRLNDLYESTGQSLPFPQQNMSSEFVNRWKTSGDENITNIPVLSDDALLVSTHRKYPIGYNMWEMYNKSNLRVVDGSFLRCTNMTLGYHIKPGICERLGVKALDVSATVTNLFIVKDSALKGRDPEQMAFGSGVIPPQRQYSMRLSLKF